MRDASASFREASSFEDFIARLRHPSDFHPEVGQLDHPAASLLEDLRTNGAKTSFKTPNWTPAEIKAAIDRGAHRSSFDHADFVDAEFVNFVRKGFWVVLPAKLVAQLEGFRGSPTGVVPQHERRPRIICDYTYFGVNDATDSDAPLESMQFGRVLIRIIQRIVLANPAFGPVFLAKYDLSDGYYRVWLHFLSILGLAVLLPLADESGETLVGLPLVLPMGWTDSAPWFCAGTETIADLANDALQSGHEQLLSPHELENHATASSDNQYLNDRVPQHAERPRDYFSNPLSYVDVYIDDLIGLVQGDRRAQTKLTRAILHNLDGVFRPLDQTDGPHRQTPASLTKLVKGDGQLLTRKTVLGWIIDTIKFTLELSDERYEKLNEILATYPRTRKRVKRKEWQRVLGQLRYMSIAMPGSRGLFGPLQAVLHPKQTRLRLTTDAHDFLDDFRWIAGTLHDRPVRLFELIPTEPTAIGATDAAGHGMGGVFFVPTNDATPDAPDYESYVWRHPFPTHVTQLLITDANPDGTITNSDLELAASIAQHDVIANTVDVREATIGNVHDNTPTVYWNIKGSSTTTAAAAYLQRLQALHRREHSYHPLHDFLPGHLNKMADDASRLQTLSNTEFLSHMSTRYPQPRTWRLCTLRSNVNSALISALHKKRCEPESLARHSDPPKTCGNCGWNSVPPSPWTPHSPPTTTPSRTSKFSRIGTAMDESSPAANPFDLAQFRRSYVISARHTRAWGPATSV